MKKKFPCKHCLLISTCNELCLPAYIISLDCSKNYAAYQKGKRCPLCGNKKLSYHDRRRQTLIDCDNCKIGWVMYKDPHDKEDLQKMYTNNYTDPKTWKMIDKDISNA